MESTRELYLKQKLGADYRPKIKRIEDSILYQDLQLYARSKGEELIGFTKVINK